MHKSLAAFVFLALSCFLVAQQAMNDATIAKLIVARISEDAIISMINTHSGNYDTSPDAIIALKHLGASDKIISAIIAKASVTPPAPAEESSATPNELAKADDIAKPNEQAGSAPRSSETNGAGIPGGSPTIQPSATSAPQNASSQTPAAPPQPPTPHTLLDGTPVKLRLSQTMSSANANVGQEVPFEVMEEVRVDDVVILQKGATAIGTVTDTNPKKSMGRAGKLDIFISYARLADQEKVALRATQGGKAGGHVGAMTGAMVATTIVFFPAAPLFLFMHGKDITIPQGTEVTAFVDGDMHLDMAKFGIQPPPLPPPTAAPQSLAILVIDSSPPAADIEIDGAFAGSTPSTINVASGSHDVRIKKSGFADWDRKLSVSGGAIHLTADFSSAAPALAPASPVAPNAAPSPAVTPNAVPAAVRVPHT